MRWPKRRRKPKAPSYTPPPGWHAKWWDDEVLPASHCMAGRVTFYHDDGFAYDMQAVHAPPDWPAKELYGYLEGKRFWYRGSTPKPLSVDEIDDATIRPDGPGRWWPKPEPPPGWITVETGRHDPNPHMRPHRYL